MYIEGGLFASVLVVIQKGARREGEGGEGGSERERGGEGWRD